MTSPSNQYNQQQNSPNKRPEPRKSALARAALALFTSFDEKFLTKEFETTNHDPKLLRKMSNVEMPLDDDEEETRLFHNNDGDDGNEYDVKNHTNYGSIKNNGNGRSKGDEYSIQSDYDSVDEEKKEEEDEWFNQEPDKPLEDLITWKSLVIGGGYLTVCGMLGYLFLRWLG